MPAASKVKMSSGEKKKGEQEHKQQMFFVSACDIFSIKCLTRKFHIATTTAKKCEKKVCSTCKVVVFFLIIRPF